MGGEISTTSAATAPRMPTLQISSTLKTALLSTPIRRKMPLASATASTPTVKAQIADLIVFNGFLARVGVPGKIEHLVQAKAVGRRGGAGAGPVASFQQRGQRLGRAAPVTHLHQRAGDVADHVLEEGGRLDDQLDARAVLDHVEPAQIADRRSRRAVGSPQRG